MGSVSHSEGWFPTSRQERVGPRQVKTPQTSYYFEVAFFFIHHSPGYSTPLTVFQSPYKDGPNSLCLLFNVSVKGMRA